MATPSSPPSSNPIIGPLQAFFRAEAAGGILLLVCAVVAFAWANSPFAAAYFDVWQTTVTVGAGSFVISKALLLWINDGLMAIFFLLVGLEIKREVLGGELSNPKSAALAVAAALGGMVVPALAYVLFNAGTELGSAAGAFRWRRTSRSPSACSCSSATASRSLSRSFSPRSPSLTTSVRSS